MKTAAIIILSAAAMTALFCGCPGCNEKQTDDIENLAADANAIGTGLQDLADGPVGDMLPPGVRRLMEMLGLGAAAAYTIWRQMQATRAKQAGSAILAAVDKLPGTKDSGVQGEVKKAVKTEMIGREIYSKANAIVDLWKAKR